MNKFFGFILSTVLVSVSFGQDFAIEAGFRSQSGVAGTGQTGNTQTGLQFGATSFFELNGPLKVRTGFLYTQHPLLVSVDGSTTSEAKTSINSLDIPVGLMYKMNDYGGVFGGLVLAMNLDSSYSGTGTLAGGKLTNVKSMATPIQFGVSFKFAPQMGATMYYESQAGEYATGLSDYKAVGVNFMFTLD